MPESINLILHNARIFGVDPRKSAVAIRGENIVAVGDNLTILDLATKTTTLLDLEGSALLPGFVDSHIHLFDWALGLQRLQLSGLDSREALLSVLQEAAHNTSPDEWIIGQGWNESRWPQPVFPVARDLDRISPENPVILWRCDLHLAVINSRAMEIAGIDANTPNPIHGVIDRDEGGNPTGILRESAIDLVRAAIPDPSPDEVDHALETAMPILHELGITGVHDFRLMDGSDGPLAFAAYQRLHENGRLPMRIWMQIAGNALKNAIGLGLRTGFGDDFLRVGHLKLFADGSQGARTAWMLEPYQETGELGMPLMPIEELEETIAIAQQSGIAVAIHAIGDRAIEELLQIFERISPPANPSSQVSIPHRVEHVQNIRPEQVQRFAALGLCASIQPIHLPDDIAMFDVTVGELGRHGYPTRMLIEAGIPVIFGSDAPVASPNPFLGLHAAITRQRVDGTPAAGWYPAQRIDLPAALDAYTINPARITGREQMLGRIAPGYLADLIAVTSDCLKNPAQGLPRAQVRCTVLNGAVVHGS